MIPRLYSGTTTDFSTIGTALADCISCTVQEERNGVFELSAVVSTTTPYFNTIKVGMLIVAKPNHTQTPQAFEIYEISSPINQQVTIRANHISYRQSFIPVSPFSCTGITATLNGLVTNSLETNPFTFSTDITNETSTYNQIEPASMRSRLGGVRGSVLDVFGGEYEWDNWTTRLWLHRGADNGVQLRLGKNITNLEQTQNYERVVTGVLPYWHNSDDTLQYYGDIQYSSAVADYPTHRTIVLDLSSDFESAPTRSQLNTAGANYLAQDSLATPNNSISVAFVDLADTTEYADSPLERVNLCDTVEVIYPALNIDYKAKAIRVLFDVLAERTLEVEIGDARSTIATTITDIVGDIDSAVKTGNRLISVTQTINREIGEITQTIGSVEERLDNLQIGATNLLLDSNAPSLTKVSAPYNRYFSDNGRSGYISAEIVEISDTPYGEMYGAEYEVIGEVTSTGHRILAFYQTASIPLIVDEEYTVSCYARVVTAGDNELAVAFQIGTSPYVTSHQPITSTEWQKYSYTFTATSNLINTSGYTRVYCGGIYCLSGTTAGKIQTVGFMFERGNQATDWEPNADDLETTIATTETRLSNEISSTAEQTKQTITAETQTKLETLQGTITTNYEKYTNESVESAKGTIQTWTSERYDTPISNLQDDVGDLQGDVSSAQSSINTIQFSISSLQASITAINNGIGKAFVVDSTGTKVFAVENNERVEGTYTLTDEDGNHYFVSNVETSWATATEFGCVQLSIGKDVNDTARWRTVMNENTLDDIYHA